MNWSNRMKAEIFFLKYAFPCSFILRQRGEISEVQLKELEKAAMSNKALPKEVLERIYFRAFEKIKPIAQEMKKGRWDLKVLKEYFLVRHNHVIEQGMYAYAKAPETLKELCKVQRGRVTDIKKDALIVEYGRGKRRPVLKAMVPDAKVGDRVMIHYGYAVEKA